MKDKKVNHSKQTPRKIKKVKHPIRKLRTWYRNNKWESWALGLLLFFILIFTCSFRDKIPELVSSLLQFFSSNSRNILLSLSMGSALGYVFKFGELFLKRKIAKSLQHHKKRRFWVITFLFLIVFTSISSWMLSFAFDSSANISRFLFFGFALVSSEVLEPIIEDYLDKKKK